MTPFDALMSVLTMLQPLTVAAPFVTLMSRSWRNGRGHPPPAHRTGARQHRRCVGHGRTRRRRRAPHIECRRPPHRTARPLLRTTRPQTRDRHLRCRRRRPPLDPARDPRRHPAWARPGVGRPGRQHTPGIVPRHRATPTTTSSQSPSGRIRRQHRIPRIATLLHDELPGIPVFIGGPAITGEREARALGADEYGATALDVAVRCIELAAG